MEALEAFGALLVGLLLRLGIPLVVTALGIIWLHRLDERWQREASQRRERAAAAAVPQARCWEQRGCPPERRAICPAYARPELPCWQVFRGANGRLQEACLDCDIFKQAPAPMFA